MRGRRAMAIALALSVLTAPTAVAQPPEDDTAQGSMMVVLDASGSMTAPLSTGGTRMDAAKNAMTTLIDALPVNIDVGFEVYGTGTGNSAAEKTAGCQDVQQLSPVGRIDRAAMKAQVASVTPRGYTPIGYSLQQAAAALPPDGPRAIVLISDGIDTCAPPPACEVAKGLDDAGVDLAVHTVGFQVDEAARAELECIANETGGEYSDAPDGDTLTDLLPEIADRAFRDYEVTGDAADGAADLTDAEFLPPGQYSDTADKDSPTYYLVNVPRRWTGHFSVVHTVEQTDERVDSAVHLRLLDPARRPCAESRGAREHLYDGPETASLTWTNDGEKCGDGAKYLEVTWNNNQDSDSDEIELRIAAEPPLSGEAGRPATEVERFTEPTAQPDVIWGGGSFNEAATIPGTGRYFDKLHYSEYSVYRVWLDWGQALSYRVSFAEGEHVGTATAATELRGPALLNSRESWWRSADYDGAATALDPVGTPTVRYANRTADDAEIRPASQAGYYYVVVKLSPLWTGDVAVPETQPTVEIAVNVTGTAEPGPKYADDDVDPSAEPATPTVTKEPATRSAAKPAGSRSSLWWLLGGVAVTVLVAVALVLVLRRRAARVRGGHSP
jgi:Ca-activated chloride channel homolog